MNRRLITILGGGGLVVFLVGGMLLFLSARDRRESELKERLLGLEQMVGKSNWVQEARADEIIKSEDLEILMRFLGREHHSDWMRRIEKELSRRLDWIDENHYEVARHALNGFAVLGTNAEPAIPALVRYLQRDENPESVLTALGLIGEPVWSTAQRFVGSNSAGERMVGAYLMGILRMNPEESVPALMRLKDDEEEGIRASALVALAEFPCKETMEFFGKMLEMKGRSDVEAGVYGLHSGNEEAMQMLVQKFDGTTNRWVHETVLRAVYAREQAWRGRKFGFPRAWDYKAKQFCFNASHNAVSLFVDKGRAEELMDQVRKKLLIGEETDLVKEMTFLRGREGTSE